MLLAFSSIGRVCAAEVLELLAHFGVMAKEFPLIFSPEPTLQKALFSLGLGHIVKDAADIKYGTGWNAR